MSGCTCCKIIYVSFLTVCLIFKNFPSCLYFPDASSDHGEDEMPTDGLFEGHQEAVNAMHIHNGLLYTCSGDRTVKAFDLVVSCEWNNCCYLPGCAWISIMEQRCNFAFLKFCRRVINALVRSRVTAPKWAACWSQRLQACIIAFILVPVTRSYAATASG